MATREHRRKFLATTASSTIALGAATLWRPHVAVGNQPSRIRVGQIGTAHAHAAGKLETFRKLSDLYEVVGVVEPDQTRRDHAKGVKAYADVPWMTEQQLFNTPGLACVAVETEIGQLVPTAQRCVDAGMHVHLDKPAGESLAAFRRLHSAATEQNRCIQMGYMFRYNPAFVLTKRAVAAGWLGSVFEAHGVISKKVNQAARKQLQQNPGGTMFELGCHLIDALIWIAGEPQKITSYARQTLDDDLIDNMLAVFEYPQATATIRTSVVEPFGFRRRQFSVVGTEGVAEIRPLEPPHMELSLEQPHGEWKRGTNTPEFPEQRGRYDGDLLDLAAVIRGDKQLEWNARHDLATHQAILRASGLGLS